MQRMHGWIGRKDRQPVAVDAVVHRADGASVAVKLSNISDEGCRIESGGDLRIGEQVEIAIPEYGRLKAQIRWAFAGSAGLKFLAEDEA